ncbi:MAG: thioredoxin family protein [Paenibacillaceae bacterium]
METISSADKFNEQIASESTTVAVFKASWCRDCHFIEPFMPDLEKQYAEKLTFVHIDRDELPDLCADYHVLGIPSFIVFHHGKELTRFVSKLRKTREEIEQFLDRSLEVMEAMKSKG